MKSIIIKSLLATVLITIACTAHAQNNLKALIDSVKSSIPKTLPNKAILTGFDIKDKQATATFMLKDNVEESVEKLSSNKFNSSNVAQLLVIHGYSLPKSLLDELSKEGINLQVVMRGENINGDVTNTISAQRLSELLKDDSSIKSKLLLETRIDLINVDIKNAQNEDAEIVLKSVSLNDDGYIHEMQTNNDEIFEMIKNDTDLANKNAYYVISDIPMSEIHIALKALNKDFVWVLTNSNTGEKIITRIASNKL